MLGLGLINRNFKHMSIPTFVALYIKVWSDPIQITAVLSIRPTEKEIYIEALEKVQKKSNKLIPALKNLPYKDRLKAFNMSTYDRNL